ncbi:MFS transporter [Allosaccharopolyspora coralli]|uniref:Lysosomal dipeptide transporter MFSD1 n=1 Tax=Allosaccharopolyspora coralli TaxID=2665642 RepID=A0A5Q3Q7F7_9PSEU|nr:MFS transporter [Allosaccharopolyspora coralli]QGK69094.1 MFS transporter [Allosaccharopolyspora coralli]
MAGDRPARSAWLVWGVAVAVYVAAVFHRGSLGVAGPQALERFGVGPAALSAFTVLQVGIYASMQIPAGLLVDRFGARRILVMSVLLLGLGQTLFAVTTAYPLALVARAVLGLGDGLTWVTILRLVALRFTTRQYALVATVSAALGGLGGVAATFPLAAVLVSIGWTGAYALLGGLTLAYAVVVGLAVHEPGTHQDSRVRSGASMFHNVGTAWRVPGTRLAFWAHFSTMFVSVALALLWGFPYLVEGLGVAPGLAGVVLSTLILGQVVGGPIVGTVISRFPIARMPIVFGYLVAALAAWSVLLGWPGVPPLAYAVTAFAIFSLGGPISAIAFAIARDYNPIHQVGVASGVANTGGHSATALSALAVGLLLQLTSTLPAAESYRIAMLVFVAMLLFGGFRTLVWWRRVRREVFAAQDRGEQVPVVLRRRTVRESG